MVGREDTTHNLWCQTDLYQAATPHGPGITTGTEGSYHLGSLVAAMTTDIIMNIDTYQ